MKILGHNPILMFVLSLVAAYVCAAVFVTVLYFSLPATDLAHGQGLVNTFSDPFVLSIAGVIATASGVIGFVVALFCLRDRDLLRCGAFATGMAIIAMLALTPFILNAAPIGAFLVALVALIFCRSTKLSFFHCNSSTLQNRHPQPPHLA